LSRQQLVAGVRVDGSRRGALVADVVYLAGGAALFASAFLHWVSKGAGSGLRGHALIDAVVALHGSVAALSTGRLTVVWYLIPVLGAAGWIACGLGGAHGRPARWVAAAALAMTLLTAVAFVHLVGFDRLGWGPKLSVVGAIVLWGASWLPRPIAPRETAPTGR
jgi:hypothetical protein